MTYSVGVVQIVQTLHIGKGIEAGQALSISSVFSLISITYVMSLQII